MPENGVLYFRRTSKLIGEHAMMLPFQPEFRPELPVVFGAKDYREFRATLEEMERILTATGIEARFIATRIEALGGDLTAKRQQWHWRTFRMALRYSILLGITSDSHRELSRRVADSQIFSGSPIRHLSMGCVRSPKARSSVSKRCSLMTILRRSFTTPTER